MTIEALYKVFKEQRSICTDSRKLVPGSIFFALKGENFDGNDYALHALENGCAYAVVDNQSLPENSRLLKFPDALLTLQKLAQYHRSQLKIPFIGITGSNGKTTCKELIAATLSLKYSIYATQGNLNNHIGVPLTVLSVNENIHEIAIIEMGANHTGEISALCRIADPDYGIITNIGRAHLEGFGSPEGVVKAKSELYDHLASHKGIAFVNAGIPILKDLIDKRDMQSVLYGNFPKSECTAEITDSGKFLSLIISLRKEALEIKVSSNLVGSYNADNMLTAACIGNYFGVKSDDIGKALSEYIPSNSRSQLLETPNNNIVLDAYNANPDSMDSSIRNFISMQGSSPKMIILGDMLELGSYSQSEHKKIIELLLTSNMKKVFLVGSEFCAVCSPDTFPCFRKVDDLIEHFRANPVKEHSILLKGSRGIKLEKLIDVL